MSKISLDIQKEKELVQAAKQNSEHFAQLYEHYYPHILRYVVGRLRDKDIAEEIVSQVFEKALKNIASFDFQGFSFSAWLYRIASNTIIDHFRKQNLRRNLPLDEIQIADNELSTQQKMEMDYQKETVFKLISELPEKERKVVYLKFYYGYTNKLIAELTQLSETNVGTILYRAIGKLKSEVRNQNLEIGNQ